MELCRLGRRVKSSMLFCQPVDTSRVIIPLHFACWWRLVFFSVFFFCFQHICSATDCSRLSWSMCHSETLARTGLHTFHPVWSYSHTYSLKECYTANWCFIYHRLHFPELPNELMFWNLFCHVSSGTQTPFICISILVIYLFFVCSYIRLYSIRLYQAVFHCLHSHTFSPHWITSSLHGNILLNFVCHKSVCSFAVRPIYI